MKKANCWEVQGCDRGPGSLSPCPVATESHAHGIHGGQAAGRVCWVVAGTLCGGEIQGTHAAKLENCMKCEFYKQVRREEGLAFRLTFGIIREIETRRRQGREPAPPPRSAREL